MKQKHKEAIVSYHLARGQNQKAALLSDILGREDETHPRFEIEPRPGFRPEWVTLWADMPGVLEPERHVRKQVADMNSEALAAILMS